MFIPAAGYRYGSDIYDVGSDGYLLSSSLDLDYPSNACNLKFNSDHISMSNFNRYSGCSVRPVINL